MVVNLPRSAQRLVALVAIAERIGRQQAGRTLWPDVDDRRAGHRMRSDLWRVSHHAMGVLANDAGGLHLRPGVQVDTAVLEAHARRALSTVRAPAHLDPVFAELGRWPVVQDLLPGWDDDWIVVERVRLRQLHLHALEASARCLLERGCFGEALDMALQVQAADPLRETAQALAVKIFLAQDNVAAAHRHFTTFETMLYSELGVRPSPRLQALVRGALQDRTVSE